MLQKIPASDETWKSWSHSLSRWGLQDIVAQFLDSAGSLTIFLAQLVYFCQPFLNNLIPSNHLQNLAAILEDSDKSKAFAAYLREGEN
jgi:hypothetical protein